MKSEEHGQLHGNIAHILEDVGLLNDHLGVADNLDAILDFLKIAIQTGDPNILLCFLDATTLEKNRVRIADIASDKEGKPMVSAVVGVESYSKSMMSYVIFGWFMKDGSEYSASYPQMAFYPDKPNHDA